MIEGLQSFQNVFKIPELKRRVLITAGLLIAYRLGAHVPTPGIDGHVLAQFFECDEVTEEPGAWTSPDRRRRLRVVSGDALARWEELDPGTGETLITVRGPAPLMPPLPQAAQVIERRVANVHGRARQPRCFAGVPHALGGKPVASGDASFVFE